MAGGVEGAGQFRSLLSLLMSHDVLCSTLHLCVKVSSRISYTLGH